MEARVKWLEEVCFVAESGSGHTVVIDGPPENGGRNIGVRPMELVLMGVGGCASFDVMSILQKARQQVTDCVAQLKAERVDAIPSVFSSIHMHFVVSGRDLNEKQVKRAVELSADKYCSASMMLRNGGVELSHSYEIQQG